VGGVRLQHIHQIILLIYFHFACVCACVCCVSYLLSPRLAFLSSVYVPFSLSTSFRSSVSFLLSSSIILPVRFLLSLFSPSRLYFLYFVSLFQYFFLLSPPFCLQFLRYIRYLRRPSVFWSVSVPDYMN